MVHCFNIFFHSIKNRVSFQAPEQGIFSVESPLNISLPFNSSNVVTDTTENFSERSKNIVFDEETKEKNSNLSDEDRIKAIRELIKREISAEQQNLLLDVHHKEKNSFNKGWKLRHGGFSEEETRNLMASNLAGIKDVNIDVTDQDETMYAPVRFLGKVWETIAAPIYKGLLGHRRRIHESTENISTSSQMNGVTSLNITKGIRDAGVHYGTIISATLESWQKMNSDKEITLIADSSNGFSNDITFFWKKLDGDKTKSFQYEKYHFPIIKQDNKNKWGVWRFLDTISAAIPFAFNRLIGKNESILQTNPITLNHEDKMVSLQVTPGLKDSKLKHNGYLITQVIKKWIESNPQAEIKRFFLSSHIIGSEETSRNANNITITYTDKKQKTESIEKK